MQRISYEDYVELNCLTCCNVSIARTVSRTYQQTFAKYFQAQKLSELITCRYFALPLVLATYFMNVVIHNRQLSGNNVLKDDCGNYNQFHGPLLPP